MKPKREMCLTWLTYWRICRKKSLDELAELWGCSDATMYRHLESHNFVMWTQRRPTVSKRKVPVCRDWLLYWRVCRKASIETIAELRGCSAPTIYVNLEAYKIPKIRKYSRVKMGEKQVRKKHVARIRSDCGVPLETAILEPERRQMMHDFLKQLSHTWKLAKKKKRQPSVAAFINNYRKIIHGKGSEVKARR